MKNYVFPDINASNFNNSGDFVPKGFAKTHKTTNESQLYWIPVPLFCESYWCEEMKINGFKMRGNGSHLLLISLDSKENVFKIEQFSFIYFFIIFIQFIPFLFFNLWSKYCLFIKVYVSREVAHSYIFIQAHINDLFQAFRWTWRRFTN